MISIDRIQSNFYILNVNEEVIIYFSYETPIALVIRGHPFVSENIWSKTTGRHLNMIEPDKDKRVPYSIVQDKIEDGLYNLTRWRR